MTSVGLDSEASFASRAKEVGMSDLLLQAFQTANLKTYGSLAFVCRYKPDQTDEGPLFDAIEALIGRAPTAGEKIPIRRLFFEAHTLALADLKMRFIRTFSDSACRTYGQIRATACKIARSSFFVRD